MNLRRYSGVFGCQQTTESTESAPEDLFRLRPAENVLEQFQRTRFLRQLYPVVARAFDDRAVLEVDASFDKRGRRAANAVAPHSSASRAVLFIRSLRCFSNRFQGEIAVKYNT